MRLLNHTLLYLSGSLLLIIGAWAGIFYYNMLDEVYDSIDDGLDNYKILIIQKAQQDSSVLHKTTFDESNYRIREIAAKPDLKKKTHHTDTLMYMQNEKEFEPVRLLTTVFTAGNGKYYELQVISSMVEEDDLLEDLFYALLWLYLVIILSVILINNLLLRRIWKPFYQVIAQLKQFSLGQNTPFTPPATSVSEFRNLNEAVLTLLSKNTGIFNSQKQFIENASHELQTPLAISMNKMELLLEENEFSEKQVQALSGVLQNLERMSRLNKSLLLLSRIENKQFGEEEQVSFNAIISQQLEDFAPMLTFRNIAVSVETEGLFVYLISKDLAAILMGNLLKNAIVHNVDGGNLKITISSGSIRIANTGPAQVLDQEKIFSRFYKTQEKKNSTGLGLAIVKTITGHYGLKIAYSYDGEHIMTLTK